MADSVYKIIEVVGTSTESWEKAATAAVNRAAKTLRDLRVAEIVQLDMQISNGKVEAYRAKEGSPSSSKTRSSKPRFFGFARDELHAEAAASIGCDRLTKASDFANVRQGFGRFRPFDDKAMQEASQ